MKKKFLYSALFLMGMALQVSQPLLVTMMKTEAMEATNSMKLRI